MHASAALNLVICSMLAVVPYVYRCSYVLRHEQIIWTLSLVSNGCFNNDISSASLLPKSPPDL